MLNRPTIESLTAALVAAEADRTRLKEEVKSLTEQLETRKLMERAKGLLQASLGISEEEAYLTMKRESRHRRKSMKDLAMAIILAEDLGSWRVQDK
jgi:uroporphyrinogen-III synthase